MSPHAHDHNPIAHVASTRMLLVVFFALVGLTVLTVWQGTQLELGRYEVIVVLAIATVKAALVCAYFMHLRYDKPLNVFAFIFSLFFIALFLGMTLADAWNYRPEVDAMDYQNASQQ